MTSASQMSADAQEALFADLQRHWQASPAERIDTHSACLLLHGEHVLKLKRAVRYNYLDMRALDTRKRLLQRELELNQAILPDIYRRVIPVVRRADGHLTADVSASASGQHSGTADEPGETVEWALLMRRFDDRQVLDAIADRGEFDNDLATATGRAVAHYHGALDPVHVDDADDRIGEVVEELADALAVFADWLDAASQKAFVSAARDALSRHRERLRRRGRDGFVKRCHGDLHLRNMVLLEDTPCPFDALEFDERMATSDVLYDAAFLWMDIAHRGLLSQANRAFNAYLTESARPGHADLGIVPLFLGCRAAIRAMTSAQSSMVDTDHRLRLRDDARRYLDEAIDTLDATMPQLIVVAGLSGCGKSTLAREIAWRCQRAPGAVLLQSDVQRKRDLGLSPGDRLDASQYTAQASDENYRRLLEIGADCLRAGCSVVIDAVFLKRSERERVLAMAGDCNAGFQGLWLEAPQATLARRIDARRHDASDATRDVLAMQWSVRTHTDMLGAGTPGQTSSAWLDIDASGDADQTLKAALAALALPRRPAE